MNNPIIKVNDWTIQGLSSEIFTDDLKADLVFAESFEEKGVGIAIMNRLNKAAGFDIINV